MRLLSESPYWLKVLECLSGTLHDPIRGQCQAGSLTGAVHLSNTNAGVLRLAPSGQKPGLEQKGKSQLEIDFQYE